MAEITAERINGDAGSFVLVWELAAGDTAKPVSYVGAADRSVYVDGVFSGAEVDIVGSVFPTPAEDGSDFGILDDNFENPLHFTEASTKPRALAQLVSKIKPVLTGGDGNTAIRVGLLVKGTNR